MHFAVQICTFIFLLCQSFGKTQVVCMEFVFPCGRDFPRPRRAPGVGSGWVDIPVDQLRGTSEEPALRGGSCSPQGCQKAPAPLRSLPPFSDSHVHASMCVPLRQRHPARSWCKFGVRLQAGASGAFFCKNTPSSQCVECSMWTQQGSPAPL